MEYEGLPETRSMSELWLKIEIFRQNELMSEAQFLNFLRDRGLPAFGGLDGDPGEFERRNWLHCDMRNSNEAPLFHPFRIYPAMRILDHCNLRIARSASLRPEGYMRIAQMMLKLMPCEAEFLKLGAEWNKAVDLAVLLEPIYWPQIVGSRRLSSELPQLEAAKAFKEFRIKVLKYVKSLNPLLWRRVHECIRLDASSLDSNSSLYILLRTVKWESRKILKGQISAALWLRHMAEVIRRGFEEAFSEKWLEEYEASGHWPHGVRRRKFGDERPLDNTMRTKPFIANEFGLFTGSSVRWYVEGDTEYFAFLELLSDDAAHYGIEIINLKGEIAANKGNSALRLAGMLREDCNLRRFSMITMDADVEANRKFVQRQIVQENFVGGVWSQRPDFEFANFSLTELIEIAADLEEGKEFKNSEKHKSIANAKEFEEWFCSVSKRSKGGLKGEVWGRALAKYANKHPKMKEGLERPMIVQWRAAVYSWSCNYLRHFDRYTLDPHTFEPITRPEKVQRMVKE